ncbi:dTMP kinase [Buchnera aphidicola (Mollitrichosiphum nigrofasciatum)]|uniref:dTMP kinase n=1 Tax=Buchnera aphidicola TaxID=9 RepID=UPI0031B806D2
MKVGKFIVLEGIDGSGKTNAIQFIKNLLEKQDIPKIITVREPGSTLLSEKIRKIIKYNFYEEKISTRTELLLMCAARVQVVENIIKPALKNGNWVLGDRHVLSTLAYQGGKNGKNQDLIKKIHKKIFKNFYPNLTIYLDVNPKLSMKRIINRKNKDRIEKKKKKFFLQTHENYLRETKNIKNIITINANFEINIVHKLIKEKLLFWVKKNNI